MKHRAIQDDIRRKIAGGIWLPSQRLPTREKLLCDYATSRATLQKAFDQLMQEDFIVSCGKAGTFVAELPPSLSSIAIVLPFNEQEPVRDLMWSSCIAQRHYFESRFKRTFSFYFLEHNDSDCKDYIRLMGDATAGYLGGIIFPQLPDLNLFEKIRKFNIPIITVTARRDIQGLCTAWLDYGMLISRALDYLQARGRTKVALLANTTLPLEHIECFRQEIRKRKLESDEHWIQGAGIDAFSPPWTVNLVRLMMRQGQNGRPDGLIVLNQNMAGLALKAIHHEELLPGRDIDIVAHASFPMANPAEGAMKRFGFDVRSMVGLCVEALETLRENHCGPFYAGLLPAISDDEATSR
jgi:hypothetical protein